MPQASITRSRRNGLLCAQPDGGTSRVKPDSAYILPDPFRHMGPPVRSIHRLSADRHPRLLIPFIVLLNMCKYYITLILIVNQSICGQRQTPEVKKLLRQTSDAVNFAKHGRIHLGVGSEFFAEIKTIVIAAFHGDLLNGVIGLHQHQLRSFHAHFIQKT